MHGVLYEPHGSHIFHTDDADVWSLANRMTPFRAYRHRVDIVADGQLLNWPILLSDIDKQSRSNEILSQLEERRHVNPSARSQAANFEEWCLELMGPLLYERFVRPYTEKQWGRPAATLSAAWAPRRVSVRWDNNPYLFSDAFQGWPAGPQGYTDLINGLLASPLITLRVNTTVSARNLRSFLHEADYSAVILTCPLDVFASLELGRLEWRGILVRHVYVPHVDLAQSAMVVNYPGPEFPFIRIHETKHASGQQCDGTVLGFEFTNAPTRYYPVELPETRALNDRYKELIRGRHPTVPLYFAGRLANYVYVDMDDCMRQAIDTAAEILDRF
jgi:UDP-galactopyranose mutase